MNDRLVILKHFKLNGIQNKGTSLIVNSDQHQYETNRRNLTNITIY